MRCLSVGPTNLSIPIKELLWGESRGLIIQTNPLRTRYWLDPGNHALEGSTKQYLLDKSKFNPIYSGHERDAWKTPAFL